MFDVSCVVVDYLLLSTDILRFRPVVLMVVNYLHQFFIYYLQGYFCPIIFFALLHLQTFSPCLEFAQTMEFIIDILFLINSKLRIVLNSASVEFAQ